MTLKIFKASLCSLKIVTIRLECVEDMADYRLVKDTTKNFFVKKKMEGENLNPALGKEAKND